MAKLITLETVGEFLDSQRFANIVAKLNKTSKDNGNLDVDTVGELIGDAISYVEFFGQSGDATLEELEEILNIIVKKKNNNEQYDLKEAFANKILRDLKLKGKDMNAEEMEIAKRKAIEIVGYRLMTKYHAFNGAFKENIQENGINPNTNLHMDEWDTIYDLYSKYNARPLPLKNDRNSVYYSNQSKVSYSYGITSPLWFKYLCGDGFVSRNYDECRKVFETVAETYNFSQEDATKLLNAFESCWKTFAVDKKPCVAVIPNNVEHTNDLDDLILSKFSNMDFQKAFSVLCAVKMGSLSDEYAKELEIPERFGDAYMSSVGEFKKNSLLSNIDTKGTLDVKGAVFIDLPNITDLEKKIEIAKAQGVDVEQLQGTSI